MRKGIEIKSEEEDDSEDDDVDHGDCATPAPPIIPIPVHVPNSPMN